MTRVAASANDKRELVQKREKNVPLPMGDTILPLANKVNMVLNVHRNHKAY